MAKRKGLETAGFRVPAAKRKTLAPETIEAFASGEQAADQAVSTTTGSQARKLTSSASSQARKDAELEARAPADSSSKSQPPSTDVAHEPIPAVGLRPRSGTGDSPYLRRDGTATRSTTIHLELDLHRRLRLRAIEENRSMSDLVTAAIRHYLG